MTNTLHVAPMYDLVDHDTSTAEADCVCGPEARPVTREDGSAGWLLVHHSLDGREQAGRRGVRQAVPPPLCPPHAGAGG